MHEPVAVRIDEASLRNNLESLQKDGSKFVWAVDADFRLNGWVDVETSLAGEDPMVGYTEIHADEVAVGPEDSLKSVLSRMLGQGIKNVPVVDIDSKLVGEISLVDIEQITET